MVILILLISILSLENCKPKVELFPVGDAKVVRQLENGNYEVTPAFLIWVGELRQEVERLKKECR